MLSAVCIELGVSLKVFNYLWTICFDDNNILLHLISLQHLTVLPTEFFCQRKTHIPSVINLPTKILRR
jgi:hypothetical protein